MSDLKYCQGPLCHTHDTKDRKKGPKDNRRNETRRRSSFNYLGGNACDMGCEREWFRHYGQRALEHFGRIHEPKRVGCDSAWYKDYKYSHSNGRDTNYDHYFVNDLLGERRPITEQQYEDTNLRTPTI